MLAGCAQQQRDEATGLIHVPDVGRAKTMEVAEDVLAKMHFAIEKVDEQSGFIRTRPLPGAQFFEFWRADNVGADNCFLANLHTIRRTVELDISQRGEELLIGCDVQVQRLSLPERDISSSARMYEMFSKSSPSLQKFKFYPEQRKAMAWIDLGKDMRLAAEILRRIEKRIAPRTRDDSRATGSQT
jgi:hypothetical protein